MKHPVRQLLCCLICLCLLPVIPADALGAAIASDTALQARLESVLRGQPAGRPHHVLSALFPEC